MSNLLPLDVDVYRLQTWRYCAIPPGAFLLLDYLLCLPDEFEFIWAGRKKLAKYVYSYVRYSPFFEYTLYCIYTFNNFLDPEECQRLFLVASVLVTIGNFTSCSILSMRTWALWNCSNRILIFLAAMLTATFGCSSALMLLWIFQISHRRAPVGGGCELISSSNRLLSFAYVCLFIMETLITIMTVSRIRRNVSPQVRQSPLVSALLIDGVSYYAYLGGVNVINMIYEVYAPPGVSLVLVPFHRIFHGVFISRILLSLPATAARSTRQGDFRTLGLIASTILDMIAPDKLEPRRPADDETGIVFRSFNYRGERIDDTYGEDSRDYRDPDKFRTDFLPRRANHVD